jgi:CBS domain-containing protein
MSGEPITAQPDWPLVQAVRTMIDNRVNRLPVVDRHCRPLGVLTRHDVLRAVAVRGRPGPGPVGASSGHHVRNQRVAMAPGT